MKSHSEHPTRYDIELLLQIIAIIFIVGAMIFALGFFVGKAYYKKQIKIERIKDYETNKNGLLTSF